MTLALSRMTANSRFHNSSGLEHPQPALFSEALHLNRGFSLIRARDACLVTETLHIVHLISEMQSRLCSPTERKSRQIHTASPAPPALAIQPLPLL